jgi:hypothetical protein
MFIEELTEPRLSMREDEFRDKSVGERTGTGRPRRLPFHCCWMNDD